MSNAYLIEENKKEEQPYALLNLEIEKGVIKQLKLYKNSNPEEVAYNFCQENNIDFSLMAQIKNEIESLNQKYLKSFPKEIKESNYNSNNISIMNQRNNPNNINYNLLNDEYSYYNLNNNSKNMINNNNRNLFFYQFLKNQEKLKNPFLNKSNSANKLKAKIYNTISATRNNYNKQNKVKGGSSYSRINNSNLTQNTTKNNSNIFNRLYNDAKIKRVVYKRPCHNGNSNSKDKKMAQDFGNNVYETINGKTFNKMTIDMSPSYIRSYQIKPYQLNNKEYSFQPNSYKYIPKNNKYATENNNYHRRINTNRPNKKRLKFKRKLYSYNNEINNNNYVNNYQSKKKMLYEESYVPLKNKIKFFPIVDENNNLNNGDNIEKLSFEAFNNLFDKLINYDQSYVLNKKTININNIDNNSVLILSNIIKDINNNDIELDLDNFILRVNSELSDEDKKMIILNYSNIPADNSNYNENNINNNYNYNQKNEEEYKQPLFIISNCGYNQSKSSKFLKNKNNTNTISTFNKGYRLPSGAEKKKNFYYL